MNKLELVEYAVYHWVFGGNYGLPGLNQTGHFELGFFDVYPVKSSYESFSDQFDQLKSDPDLSDENSLMLCSGGVDSSLLSCFRKKNLKNSQQNFLHTFYTDHDNNDLYKFSNILFDCPSMSVVSSIDSASYMEGIEFLAQNNFFQNTYGPTLAFSLNSIATDRFTSLITGSGPDELFYGMEKYSWDVFEDLSGYPVVTALEKIDPRYNEVCYTNLFNNEGKDLFHEVRLRRLGLYENIAELEMSIFDSQRLLAYATVTAQHMQLFNTIANLFELEHKAPYLNTNLVKLALTTPLDQLVDIGDDKRVEIGKKYLKKYLSNYMSFEHVYGRKIGFHAPTSRYIFENGRSFLIDNIEFLPSWLDKDLTLGEVKKRYDHVSGNNDYFLYSLLNIIKHNKRQIS